MLDAYDAALATAKMYLPSSQRRTTSSIELILCLDVIRLYPRRLYSARRSTPSTGSHYRVTVDRLPLSCPSWLLSALSPMPKLAPWGGAVVAAVLASAVALACWSAEAPKSDKEALLAAAMRAYGGHQVNSVPPAWQRDGFLDAATLQHIERVLPPDEKWAACGEDPTVRCAFLPIDGEPILQDVLRRAGAMWLANVSAPAAGLPVKRLLPGSPGLPAHIDHLHPDGTVPDYTVLVHLGAPTAAAANDVFFPASGLRVPCTPGRLLGWRNKAWEGGRVGGERDAQRTVD